MEQFIGVAKSAAESLGKDVFEKVSEHSIKFDKEITETRVYSKEEVRERWQTREWKIGDTIIQAIGVSHVPETFLEFRQEIEQAIQESDVVVNEFAPEALGFYDKTSADRLRGIESKFRKGYNLEQLRQKFNEYERQSNMGIFQHEIELLAAKYDKDMALADLAWSKDPEDLLQGEYLYDYWAKQAAENKALLKKAGLYTSAAVLGIVGLVDFVNKPQSMSRRKFLNLGLMAGAAAIAGVTPKITETLPQSAFEESMKIKDDQNELVRLRDAKLAEVLQQLSKAGYKKIVFIYGKGHLEPVEKYLGTPEKGASELAASKHVIERNNPDAFRLYRQSYGNNHSERFVASEKKVWKRIPLVK